MDQRPGETGHRGTAAAAPENATVLDHLPDGYAAITPDGVLVGWNRTAQAMLGWHPDEVLGRQVDELVVPDYAGEAVRGIIQEGLEEPSGEFQELWGQHRDGRRLRLQTRLTAVPGPAGPVMCLFFTDRSGQRDADRDADRERSFTEAILDNLQTGVAAVDAEGRLTVVNRVLRELHGLPEDLSPGEAFRWITHLNTQVFYPDGGPVQMETSPLGRALAGESVRNSQMMVRIPGAPPRYLEANAQQVRRPDGELLGAVATLLDVTERRRFERFADCRLRVAQVLAETGSAEEAAPAITQAVAESLGWPHVELWLADEATERMYRIAAWTHPRLNLAGLIPPWMRRGEGVTGTVWVTGEPLWIPDLAHTDALGIPNLVDRAAKTSRRGLRTVLGVPVRDGDTVLGVLNCATDAAEYDRDVLADLLDQVAQQVGHFLARRRTEALALELAQAKDDFIALVGHEMRTPLTSIATYTELLASGAEDWSPTDRRLLDVIARNTTALRAIIDDLLDLTAVESGHLRLTPTRVDLAALVGDAVTAITPTANRNDVRLDTHLPERLELPGDPGRLRQVVDNLLSNAVKYSPDGGDVRVSLTEEDGVAELVVADAGIGIPEEERHRLGDRFYRASSARQRGIPGTGLGLSITRALVEAHRGTIAFTYPEKHSGTIVTVRLPTTDRRRGQ